MISVEEALSRLLEPLEPLPPEQVSIVDSLGRVLAEDVAARRTQPPFAVSAMDGYAVRAEDVITVPVELRIVAEVPAGAGFGGHVGAGETARARVGCTGKRSAFSRTAFGTKNSRHRRSDRTSTAGAGNRIC